MSESVFQKSSFTGCYRNKSCPGTQFPSLADLDSVVEPNVLLVWSIQIRHGQTHIPEVLCLRPYSLEPTPADAMVKDLSTDFPILRLCLFLRKGLTYSPGCVELSLPVSVYLGWDLQACATMLGSICFESTP